MNALIDLPFDEARKLKFQAGRQEHRQASTDEFQGDPALEFYYEQLDGYNYLEELQARGYHVSPFRFASIRSNAEWAKEIHQERGQS